MNAIKQSTWLFLTLITLACSGWYFSGEKIVTKLDEQTLSTTPDTVITQLTLRQYNIKGSVSHYLQTPSMDHVPLNNTHHITTPHIIVAQENQSPWEINAIEAIAIEGGQQISFNKNVVIHQPKAAHAPESTLATESMTYFPHKQFATTDKKVTFTQAGNVVTSIGMNAYLAESRVQLLSNAQATYESNHG